MAREIRKVALYARVSKGDEQDPEHQWTRLRATAAARGWTVYAEYTDKVSGARANRPALNELRAHIRARWVDAVVAVRIDRLGRSVLDLQTLSQEMLSAGCDLVILDQPIDTSTPIGRLFFGLVACFAEFEREVIRERTRDALVTARARGKRIGRHPKNCECPTHVGKVANGDSVNGGVRIMPPVPLAEGGA